MMRFERGLLGITLAWSLAATAAAATRTESTEIRDVRVCVDSVRDAALAAAGAASITTAVTPWVVVERVDGGAPVYRWYADEDAARADADRDTEAPVWSIRSDGSPAGRR